ncbi:MAG: hypothetical protein EBZ47_03310 [Chlamydiae bacterium]|nr:hypothetical protein [Chlamydiota bacterium]
MHKLLFPLITAMVSFTGICQAALPPLPQAAREIEAIVKNDFFRSKGMLSEGFVKIEKTDEGFIVETNHFVIPVIVEYLPKKMPGPVHFEVYFDEENIIKKDKESFTALTSY